MPTLSDSIVISKTDTPTREGTRLNSIDELSIVPNPYVGMLIFIDDVDKFIYVKSLKSKVVGGIVINNAIVDEYEYLQDDSFTWTEVQ